MKAGSNPAEGCERGREPVDRLARVCVGESAWSARVVARQAFPRAK